jgi:protein-L-isoaspartate(D-aspartate) O-methyltransferase
MDRDTELQNIRNSYARTVLANVGVTDKRIEHAFATVRREHYLGAGPWKILRDLHVYEQTCDDNPAHLYTDDLIGIIPEQQLNNGQPSFHAYLIGQAAPAEGEHVVHIGAGVGYYTAIFAELVGSKGSVTAIEYLPTLATRAKANLRHLPHVHVIEGDGALTLFPRADVIYVNAGATRPADFWLDQLTDGGRLILPLTTDKAPSEDFDRITTGGVFRIERRGDAYFAKCISGAAIFPCVGNRDPESELALAAAFQKGGVERVTRLYRDHFPASERCWLQAPGWCLAYS